MTTAETWASRTEVQVAADALWALLEAGLLPKDEPTVRRACEVIGIEWTDVREASARDTHRTQRPPAQEPVRPHTEPPERNGQGPRPGGHAGYVRRAPAGPVTTDVHVARRVPQAVERRCRKCGESKPLDEFPLRKGRDGGRSHWCRPCSEGASERVVEQLRAGELALVRLALHFDDAAVGMPCAECDRALREGDVIVVGSKPKHDRCPA